MSNSQNRRCPRRVIKAAIVISVAICIVISLLAWLNYTMDEPMRTERQIGKTIISLASKCPPDMTKEQWEVAVRWTNNLPGECLLPRMVNLDDMRRLQRELEERAKGKVDMDLIFWIWDEVAKISPVAGPHYKERFQQVMLDEMQGKR